MMLRADARKCTAAEDGAVPLYAFFTPCAALYVLFLHSRSDTAQMAFLMQERRMDIVWIAAVAALWVVMAGMVVGLFKLDTPKGERS